ncbi:hypothetical protein BJ944DRAFT_273543 [Cunninghamella echinulata]|nr:hypothetical protein BJ944DRAFT_273543 [Cunninghamella echinulata]
MNKLLILFILTIYVLGIFSKPIKKGSGVATFYTYYGFGQCGIKGDSNSMFVSLPGSLFNQKLCGRSITIKGPLGTAKGIIVDKKDGSTIDLTRSLYTKIANVNSGQVKVQYAIN